MATAKKLPSGSWRCLVFSHKEKITLPDGTLKEKRIYKSFTCDDPTKAGKRKCEKIAAQWAAEKDYRASCRENEAETIVTLEDAISEYIEEKRPLRSPATIRGYINILNGLKIHSKWILGIDINRITQDDIQKLVGDLTKIRTPKTIRNYHGLISATLKNRKVEITLRTALPQKLQPTLYIPTDDDIKKIIGELKDTELEIPVLLAAFCTMRRGEICGLSMSDIDGDVIHIHHSLVQDEKKNWKLKAPKTLSSDRYVQAPKTVIEKIQEKGYITNMTPNQITRRFDYTLKKIGIPHFRFHDLRHYSASIQHALGIPDAYIMQRGGWGSDSVLKAVYRHAMNDRQKEMNQIANGHFESLCNTVMQHENEKPLK